jgi:hypothetical protein
VLENAERLLRELQELLKNPTPENVEAANERLAALLTALQAFAAEPQVREKRTPGELSFLTRLPSEMRAVLQLFKGPVDYLQGLALFRAQMFGSYNREGLIKGLGQESSARTITHL